MENAPKASSPLVSPMLKGALVTGRRFPIHRMASRLPRLRRMRPRPQAPPDPRTRCCQELTSYYDRYGVGRDEDSDVCAITRGSVRTSTASEASTTKASPSWQSSEEQEVRRASPPRRGFPACDSAEAAGREAAPGGRAPVACSIGSALQPEVAQQADVRGPDPAHKMHVRIGQHPVVPGGGCGPKQLRGAASAGKTMPALAGKIGRKNQLVVSSSTKRQRQRGLDRRCRQYPRCSQASSMSVTVRMLPLKKTTLAGCLEEEEFWTRSGAYLESHLACVVEAPGSP